MALQQSERLERARLQYENLYLKTNSSIDERQNINDISVDSLNINNNYANKSGCFTSSNSNSNSDSKSYETPSSIRFLHGHRKSDTSKNSLFRNQDANGNDSVLWDERSSIIVALQVLNISISYTKALWLSSL